VAARKDDGGPNIANRGLLELKRQVQAGEPRSVIGQTVKKIEEMLGATGRILCMPAILMTRLRS
jgi:hypothetical protein